MNRTDIYGVLIQIIATRWQSDRVDYIVNGIETPILELELVNSGIRISVLFFKVLGSGENVISIFIYSQLHRVTF